MTEEKIENKETIKEVKEKKPIEVKEISSETKKEIVQKENVSKVKPIKKPKDKKKSEEVKREYVIPLRAESRKVPRYRRTQKAVKAVKEFLARHMKIYDRDLNKIKIDSYLNEFLWARGIKNPPHKIKVVATKNSEGIVKVELVDYPDKLKFKKARAEKQEKSAEEISKKKKEKKTKEIEKSEEEKKAEEEKKTEDKEKSVAGAEAVKKVIESEAKQIKKQKQPTMKQPKHQVRKALAK